MWLNIVFSTNYPNSNILMISNFFYHSIQKEHATITYVDQEVSIEPACSNAIIKVNGLPLTQQKILSHMDRILLGK